LGEDSSLLTNLATASTKIDFAAPSPVLSGLVSCLKRILKNCGPKDSKPTLILNGDLLELALSPLGESATVFSQFIELTMPASNPMFDSIIVIPGNHDHHLWQSARDTQYVEYIKSGQFPPGAVLPEVWNATNIFVAPARAGQGASALKSLESYMLQGIARRFNHLKDLIIPIAYPSLGLLKPDLRRAVIFNHGHYIESIYLLMSTLKTLLFPDRKPPETVWDIEAENGAWIDFFWSALGSSGEVGQKFETIYDKLNVPDEVTKLICNLMEGLIEKEGGLPDVLPINKILFPVFAPLVRFIANRERAKPGVELSEETETGLRSYLCGPLQKQIADELKKRKDVLGLDELPEVTFVFGHTHKPFTRDITVNCFPGWTHTYNTGGWVVDTLKPEPAHGGAILLLDENLEAVLLRMYNEREAGAKWEVFAEASMRGSNMSGQLLADVKKLLNTNGPWKTFPAIAAEAVSVRREHLINSALS
jgi:hypothetical protein